MPDPLSLTLNKLVPTRFVVFVRIVKIILCLAVVTLAIPLSGFNRGSFD